MYLPLLNALKTFVVAANRLNFTKASEDLLVSPSAISHQIKVLEDYLNVKLFFRKNRSLVLTREGEILYQSLEGPFNQINKALQNIFSLRSKQFLNVALRPFLSGYWLTSKLQDFWLKNPDVGVNLIHSIEIPNFQRDNIDIAIVWGKGDWSNLEISRLIPGNLTPICSASYIEKHGRPRTPEDLLKYVLIHDENHNGWTEWFMKALGKHVLIPHNLNIDDTNVRLRAVENNQGIMLSCPYLLRRQLEQGTLVQIFDICLEDYAYYVVYPKNTILSDKEQLFVDWLHKEASSHT